MALRSFGQGLGQQLQQQLRVPARVRWYSLGEGGAKLKKPEQMTEEELRQSLPSMLFTTSNLIWSTTLAVGVAAGGLLAMFWVGTFITGAARSLRHLEEPAPAAPPAPQPTKSLAQLIAERKAELQAQLDELQQLLRTQEVKQALAEAKRELRQYRDPDASWWKWW
eukprot:GHUV01003250.1.p1 GENE.GHUV01003250.1~~GHUV01003250.1.p1  ORF type:complete len:166 (+),score=54.32 GHUV01003250.1:303-800(+)